MRDVSRLAHEEKSVGKFPNAIISQRSFFFRRGSCVGPMLDVESLE